MLEFVLGFVIEVAAGVIDYVLDPVGRLVLRCRERQRAKQEMKNEKAAELKKEAE